MPDMEPTMPLEAVKIDEKTYRIEDNGVRSLLFIGTERALLVDTGFGQAESLKKLVETLTDKPVMLVVSHADFDHIGNNAEFGTAYMHPSEMSRFSQNETPNAEIAPIWEGEIIDIGGRSFEVILIPGHTPGSIALLDRENRIILTGDSISSGPIFMFGEGRNIPAYIMSMEKLAGMKDAFDEIYPAHSDIPLPPEQIDKSIEAAKKLLAGELSPEDPPFPLPAKVYMHNGAGFFY